MVMGFVKKLFGTSAAAEPERDGDPVEHEGFTIIPAPVRDGSSWRVAGRITREIDGTVRTYEFVRADTFADREAAIETSLFKGRRIVDEQGQAMFRD